jgi:tetratricopeptide (TPR) repeat protein
MTTIPSLAGAKPPPPKTTTPGMPPPIKPAKPAFTDEPTGDDSKLRIQRTAPADDVIDLPAPVSERRPAQPARDDDLIDLPAPKGPSSSRLRPVRPDIVDLPAPKTPSSTSVPVRGEGLPDLPAPKRPAMIDLDAPDPDDLPLSAKAPRPAPPSASFEMPGADGLELDSIDVVAPKAMELDSIDVVAPKTTASGTIGEEPDLPAPKLETMDVAPVSRPIPAAPAVADRSLDDPTPIEAIKPDLKGKPKKTDEFEEDEEAPRKRRGMGALIAVAAVVMVIGGVGVGLGLFTSHGWFGMNLLTGKSAESEAKLQAARKLMLDDTLAGYKKAALDLKQLNDADPRLVEAQALEAQARLLQGRLGVAAEGKAGEQLVAKLPTDPKEVTPEIRRAKALKLVVAGNAAQARSELSAILASAPSDAIALTYLGWTEAGAGDDSAAEAAFGKAVQAEAGRAAALYGEGLADEHLGRTTEAADLYGRALSRSPQHFGAAVGQARLEAAKLGAQTAQQKIEELIAKRAATAAPRELSDAWVALGSLASQAGRRDEAEERLKKALTLDPDSVRARVLLSMVQCDGGKAAQTVAPLQKIVAAEPKNLDARLALARALIEGGTPHEAQMVMTTAAAQAPKDPRVLYWQGRLALADKGDRDGALKFYKDAIAGDPRYIAAYLAESNALAQLGKNEDALAALKQAEDKASDDPQLMLELGLAYLQINRAADAEARFRAALEKRPDFLPARVALGASLESQNKLDEAGKEYAAVAAQQADYAGLTERQASLAARQGKKEEAWALYAKALSQGVPTAFLKLQVASLALDLNKADEARKLAEEVVKEDDRNAVGHLTLARAHLARKSPEEALAEARRAATIADLPEAHLVLARSLEQLAKLDQAVQEYNLARRPPVEAEASIGRARIMVRMGATRDALAELGALAQNPKLRAQALLLEGDCYADLTQKDKARKAYEDAVKAAPDSGEASFKLGRAYLDAGRRKDAVVHLEKALKLSGDQAPFAVEAWLLAGDAHRESKEKDAAVRAYKKYLELAPQDAPARNEVTRQLSILGG